MQDPSAPAGGWHARDEAPLHTRWLRFPPAPEERIHALEQRLGHRLRPSYRTLRRHRAGPVARGRGGPVRVLPRGAGRRPHARGGAARRDVAAGAAAGCGGGRGLCPAGSGGVDAAREWVVHCWASWRASPPERYASFRVFMEAMHREFHRLQVDRSERAGAEYVNATTRALDASVEAARQDALGGRSEPGPRRPWQRRSRTAGPGLPGCPTRSACVVATHNLAICLDCGHGWEDPYDIDVTVDDHARTTATHHLDGGSYGRLCSRLAAPPARVARSASCGSGSVAPARLCEAWQPHCRSHAALLDHLRSEEGGGGKSSDMAYVIGSYLA